MLRRRGRRVAVARGDEERRGALGDDDGRGRRLGGHGSGAD